MRSGTCSFSGFSIRRYVAEVRQRDVGKCWPFHPHLSKSRLGQGTSTQLLSHEENVIQLREKSEQQIHILEDNIGSHDPVNAMCKIEVVVPYSVNNQNPDGLENNSTFHPREGGTYERGEEDGTNEKWACHLLEGVKSEEILSENNVNKSTSELEPKLPCFLREDETKEVWAENKTNENRAKGDTDEQVAEEETNEKHAAYHLSQDIKSGAFYPKKCVNKKNLGQKFKSHCLLRDKTKKKEAEGKTKKGVAEESDEKWTKHHISGDGKSEEILSQKNMNKKNPEVEAKPPCLLRSIKSKEILSENKANQQVQSLTHGSSDQVIAVRSSDSIVTKPKTEMQPHIHSFPKGTRLRTSKILLNERFSQGKFAKGITSRKELKFIAPFKHVEKRILRDMQHVREIKLLRKNRTCMVKKQNKFQLRCQVYKEIYLIVEKRELELPPGANRQRSQKKKQYARSNIDKGPQKEIQPERSSSNIVILALPAFKCKKDRAYSLHQRKCLNKQI